MAKYEVDYSYSVPEWGTVTLSADNPDEAEEIALEQIKELDPDILNITVEAVKELQV